MLAALVSSRPAVKEGLNTCSFIFSKEVFLFSNFEKNHLFYLQKK